MTQPVRLQLSRRAGFELQALSSKTNGRPAVKVDRTTPWGNKMKVGERLHGTETVIRDAAHAVELFRAQIIVNPLAIALVAQHLRGKNLACWCKPGAPCHADVLLELANR